MRLNLFPVNSKDGFICPWNIHRVNLSRLPILDVSAQNVAKWLNPLVGFTMSGAHERSLKRKNESDAFMFLKSSLHDIVIRSSGTQGMPARRVFALRDMATEECDTTLFISDLRYDLQFHSVVCDGYVLPLVPQLMDRIRGPFSELVSEGNIFQMGAYKGEMQSWKQLLPALVERCRSLWTHGEKCEYKCKEGFHCRKRCTWILCALAGEEKTSRACLKLIYGAN